MSKIDYDYDVQTVSIFFKTVKGRFVYVPVHVPLYEVSLQKSTSAECLHM